MPSGSDASGLHGSVSPHTKSWLLNISLGDEGLERSARNAGQALPSLDGGPEEKTYGAIHLLNQHTSAQPLPTRHEPRPVLLGMSSL